MQQSTSFVVVASDRQRVMVALAESGCAWAPAAPAHRHLLDTFDGRLHKAGLRLAATVAGDTSLTLSTARGAERSHGLRELPRLAAQLPADRLGERVARAIGVRALLPLVSVSEQLTAGVVAAADGAIAARLTLHDDIRIVGRTRGGRLGAVLEIEAAAGHGKRTKRLLARCQELGLQPATSDVLTRAADVDGTDLAGIAALPSVPLDPAMHSLDGFRAVLANLLATIEANWNGALTNVDPEFLHVLRVATRRSRTVINQGKAVLPPTILDTVRQGLAQIGAITGDARDLDVYLIEWQRYTAPLGDDVAGALEPVRQMLHVRRAAAYATMAEQMASAEMAAFLTTWGSWLRRPVRRGQRGPHAERALAPFVLARIERAQATLIERGRMITPSSPANQVHELRKDAKKVRYLVESFGSLLPPAPRKRFVQRLKALQDNLGAHQDAEVHVAELRAMSRALHDEGAGVDTMLAVGRLIERLDRQRAAARVEFAERFRAYDTKATERALAAALAITA